MAITKDIEFGAGEDKTLKDTIFQADGVTVQNITGWTFECRVEEHERSTTAKITKTSADGIVIVDAVNGIINVNFVKADTINLRARVYVYKIWRVDNGDNIILTEGKLTLKGYV